MRFVQSYWPPRVTQWSLRSRTCLMVKGLWMVGSLGEKVMGEEGGYVKKEVDEGSSGVGEG